MVIAIKESGVAREKLFVTRKVLGSIAEIPAAPNAILKNLRLTLNMSTCKSPTEFTARADCLKLHDSLPILQRADDCVP